MWWSFEFLSLTMESVVLSVRKRLKALESQILRHHMFRDFKATHAKTVMFLFSPLHAADGNNRYYSYTINFHKEQRQI